MIGLWWNPIVKVQPLYNLFTIIDNAEMESDAACIASAN